MVSAGTPYFIERYIASLAEVARGFACWWVDEAARLMPHWAARHVRRPKQVSVVVSCDSSEAKLELLGDEGRIEMLETLDQARGIGVAIAAALESRKIDRDKLSIGVRLPREHFFSREMTLPMEAVRAVKEISLQSLQRHTPFKLDDVLTDYSVVRLPPDRIKVQQWIVKRRVVDGLAERIKLDRELISFICSDDAGNGSAVPYIAVAKQRPRPVVFVRAVQVMSVLTLLMAVAAGGARYWKQQDVMDELAVRVSEARLTALRVRQLGANVREKEEIVGALRNISEGSPRLVEVWNELTKVLPAHTWLTELRLTEGKSIGEAQVAFSGFSSAAPSLVDLVEKSRFFEGTALAAPVAIDPTEGRDRFSIMAKVSRLDGSK